MPGAVLVLLCPQLKPVPRPVVYPGRRVFVGIATPTDGPGVRRVEGLSTVFAKSGLLDHVAGAVREENRRPVAGVTGVHVRRASSELSRQVCVDYKALLAWAGGYNLPADCHLALSMTSPAHGPVGESSGVALRDFFWALVEGAGFVSTASVSDNAGILADSAR